MITVLAGGVGAARMLSALSQVVDPADLTAIVNVGDDLELHGLRISPDLDTVTYTLASAINPETGWGLTGETWNAMDALGRYGGVTWFGLGDRDLATHLYRTQRLADGATLTEVTAEITAAWDLPQRLLPVTEDAVRTHVTVVDPEGPPLGHEVTFQEYFVKRHHAVPVRAVRFAGAEHSTPAPGVLDAIAHAEVIVIAPSNPIVSIGPIFAVPGIRDAILSRRDAVVAVSPIIAGKALKGPADRLLTELGHDASAVGIARIYAQVAGTLVIDEQDVGLAPVIEDLGMQCAVTNTIMRDPEVAAALARVTLAAAGGDG